MKKTTAVIAALTLLALLILTVIGLQLLTAAVNRSSGQNQAAVTQRVAPNGSPYWRIQSGPANAWLLPADEGYLLIDTGYPHDYPRFRRGLEAAGIDIAQIRYLFITHAHDEHAGFAAPLKAETGCRLILPQESLPDLAGGRFTWDGVSVNLLVEVTGRLYNLFMNRDFLYPPVVPGPEDIILTPENRRLPRQWGIPGAFLATPGHSQDSWSLVLDDGRAFVGDAAMNFLQPLGAGYRPVFMEDRREVYRSFTQLRRAGARTLLTGHGPAFSVEKLPEFQAQAPPSPGLTGLLGHLLHLIPGLTLFILLLALTRQISRAHRIWLSILAFILIRDLMTPKGLWTLGSDPVFWIRFAPDGPLLILLALGSLFTAGAIHLFERRRGPSFPWFRHGRIQPLLAGILGALAVSAPLLLLRAGILPGERGGPFPLTLAPALLAVALAGNLLEEILFRGYLQQDLQDQGLSPLKAALGSGIAFGFGHSFLAFTVTSAGLPLLLFALWEGILCGLLRMRWGLTAAVLTHGLAIWLIALF